MFHYVLFFVVLFYELFWYNSNFSLVKSIDQFDSFVERSIFNSNIMNHNYYQKEIISEFVEHQYSILTLTTLITKWKSL